MAFQKGTKFGVKKILSKSVFLCYSIGVSKGRGFGSAQAKLSEYNLEDAQLCAMVTCMES